MRKIIRPILLPVFFICLVVSIGFGLLLTSGAVNTLGGSEEKAKMIPKLKRTFELTKKEKTWFAKHPKIRVGIMEAWPPLNFVNKAGTPDGIGVDYLMMLNERLGGVMIIEAHPFKDNFDKVKNRELDALMDITPKKEREPFFNFTKQYLEIPHVLVGRKDGVYLNSEQELSGKTVALERGFYNIKYFGNVQKVWHL